MQSSGVPTTPQTTHFLHLCPRSLSPEEALRLETLAWSSFLFQLPLPGTPFCLPALHIALVLSNSFCYVTSTRPHPGIPVSSSCPLNCFLWNTESAQTSRVQTHSQSSLETGPTWNLFGKWHLQLLQLLKPSSTLSYLVFLPKPYPNPPADPAISTCPSPNKKTTKIPSKFQWLLAFPNPLFSITWLSLLLCNSVPLAPHCLFLTQQPEQSC